MTVFAIDIGSSSVRALAYDPDGHPFGGVAQRSYQASTTPDGGAEFDAVELLEQVLSCIDQALSNLKLPIQQVGIDTFATNLFGIDASGQPVTPLYMWNDTRSRAYVSQLDLNPQMAYEQTGTPPHVSYWPSRLRWLREAQPDAFRQAVRWLSIGEWLHLKLFGVARVSTSMAAWTGMLNRHSAQWNPESVRAAGIDLAQLSEISDAPFGKLDKPFADRWPGLREAVWSPAIADGYAANVGCGCSSPDSMALTVGTSGALRVLVAGVPERVPRGLFCYRVDANYSLLGGALSNAGNIYAWLQRTIRLDHDPFQSLAEADGHGLTVLPFWAGERSPGWHDAAQAAIIGMTLDTTAADIARACLEGVIYQAVQIDRVLCESLGHTPRIIAAGGALAASPGWAQMAADALGRPVAISAEPEATARGTALITRHQLADSVASIGTVYDPRPALTERYRSALLRQQRAYDLLIGKPL